MLDASILKTALRRGKIQWRRHALERMLERDISRQDVKKVLAKNDQIESYVDDLPFPSALFMGKMGSKVLHVVAALDERSGEIHMISAYEPDRSHFEKDMRRRKGRHQK